jgi:hypothetical protein
LPGEFYYCPSWELAVTADSLYETRSGCKKKKKKKKNQWIEVWKKKKSTTAAGNKLLLNFASIISKPKGTYFEIEVKK